MKEEENRERDEFFDSPQQEETAAQAPSLSPIKKWGIAFGAVLLAVVFFFGGWFAHYFSLDEGLRTFLWAKETTEKHYFEEIDEDALYEGLLDALEAQVDRYSRFYTEEEYETVILESQGTNSGLGITITEKNGKPFLYSVVQNSPACLAGLKEGMYVLGYGAGDALETGNLEQFKTFLGAQTGELTFRCGYALDGTDAENFSVTRRKYSASYCFYRDSETSYHFRDGENGKLKATQTDDALPSLNGDTAYIKLISFNGNAAWEFEQLLSVMKERGRTNLVLDLRGNGGGYMDVLCSIASHLMRNAEDRRPIVATAKYRSGKKTAFVADGNDFSEYFAQTAKITLLADENSASATECLIGALIDYGTIGYGDVYLAQYGETAKTYGKGIMQSHFTSPSGDVMKLTVASVHWPVSDTCIHGVGVTPEDGAHAVPAEQFDKGDGMLLNVLSKICD